METISDELRRASVRVRLKGLTEAADLMTLAADRLERAERDADIAKMDRDHALERASHSASGGL